MSAFSAVLKSGNLLALSIRQPWCHHILYDGKDVENRDWPTKFRGWCLIHASKSETEDRRLIQSKQMPLGGIVGAMKIVDCVSDMESDWFHGDYGFVIGEALPLAFTPCKGQLGFFRPEFDVLEKLRAAFDATPSPGGGRG